MTPASLGPKKMLRDKCNLAVGLADKSSSDLAQRHFTLSVFVIHSVLMSKSYLLNAVGVIYTTMVSPWNPSDLYCAIRSPTTIGAPATFDSGIAQ